MPAMRTSLQVLLALLLAPALAHCPSAAAGEQASTAVDRRPVVRLRVLDAAHPEDAPSAQIVEGRLIGALADTEAFRTVAPDKKGDFLLVATIREIRASAADYVNPGFDTMGGPRGTVQKRLIGSLEMDIRLEDGARKEIYTGRISSQASREIEAGADTALELVKEEMFDRAARQIEKIVRKRLRKLG
jgi:hypothetical protein